MSAAFLVSYSVSFPTVGGLDGRTYNCGDKHIIQIWVLLP